jgi:hypothetical protein
MLVRKDPQPDNSVFPKVRVGSHFDNFHGRAGFPNTMFGFLRDVSRLVCEILHLHESLERAGSGDPMFAAVVMEL